MNILLPGQYPRSERLIAASRDFDRGRVTEKELEEVRKKDFKDIVHIQKGLPYHNPGLFHWQDLIRPFGELIENTHSESLNRFFETNTFWKLLELKGDFRIKEEIIDKWVEQHFFAQGMLHKDAKLIFTLPFVYLFQEFSRGISLDQIVKVLETAGKALGKYPNKIICFYEPSFGWKPISHDESKAAVHLLENLKKHTESPIYITTSFFPLKGLWKQLYELPADGYGIDMYANSFHAAMQTFPKDKTLLAGFINTSSTLIEKDDVCHTFIKQLTDHLAAGKVI